jgi:hypothetical protein
MSISNKYNNPIGKDVDILINRARENGEIT